MCLRFRRKSDNTVGWLNVTLTWTSCPFTSHLLDLNESIKTNKNNLNIFVTFVRCSLFFLGGRINSRDVWMYNSQLNLWIRVASLNKGRWRHKMGVLLGKVRRKYIHATATVCMVTPLWMTHGEHLPVDCSNLILNRCCLHSQNPWLHSLRSKAAVEATCLTVTHYYTTIYQVHSFSIRPQLVITVKCAVCSQQCISGVL